MQAGASMAGKNFYNLLCLHAEAKRLEKCSKVLLPSLITVGGPAGSLIKELSYALHSYCSTQRKSTPIVITCRVSREVRPNSNELLTLV